MTDLRDFTSLRVGGPAKNFVEAHNEEEIIAALVAAGDSPVLILGGGTNVLISDAGFAGTVIHITNSALVSEVDACSGATLTIGAGENWDDFVALTIERGFAGLETLSGIPGTVGAAPIQNIGAYGHEVSEFITRVRTYDRVAKAIKTFTNQECEFEYRSSIFKRNPGQFIILEVQFQIRIGDSSDPITYLELAKKLDIQMGEKAPTQQVRPSGTRTTSQQRNAAITGRS
jgi:UDP-N-acetylmuramate dehydrogenase